MDADDINAEFLNQFGVQPEDDANDNDVEVNPPDPKKTKVDAKASQNGELSDDQLNAMLEGSRSSPSAAKMLASQKSSVGDPSIESNGKAEAVNPTTQMNGVSNDYSQANPSQQQISQQLEDMKAMTQDQAQNSAVNSSQGYYSANQQYQQQMNNANYNQAYGRTNYVPTTYQTLPAYATMSTSYPNGTAATQMTPTVTQANTLGAQNSYSAQAQMNNSMQNNAYASQQAMNSSMANNAYSSQQSMNNSAPGNPYALPNQQGQVAGEAAMQNNAINNADSNDGRRVGGARPCELCNKTFEGGSAKTSRASHLAQYHFKEKIFALLVEKEAPFKCHMKDCNYSSNNRTGWALHMGRVHKVLDKYAEEWVAEKAANPNAEPEGGATNTNQNQMTASSYPAMTNGTTAQPNQAQAQPYTMNGNASYMNNMQQMNSAMQMQGYNARAAMNGAYYAQMNASQQNLLSQAQNAYGAQYSQMNASRAMNGVATQGDSTVPKPSPLTPVNASDLSNKSNLSADGAVPGGEAQVYKLTMPGTRNEEYYVQLKAYSSLRQENNVLKANNSTEWLQKLITSTNGSHAVNMSTVQEIVKQNQGSAEIQALCKKLMSTGASSGDSSDTSLKDQKIKDLEANNKQLQDFSMNIKQAYNNLTLESRTKLEMALNEVEKATGVEKSLLSKIEQLEEEKKQLEEKANQGGGGATGEGAAATDSGQQQQLEAAYNEIKKLHSTEVLMIQKIQKLEETNTELQKQAQTNSAAISVDSNDSVAVQLKAQLDKSFMDIQTAKQNEIVMLERIQALEENNKYLQNINESAKEANANLAEESRQKLEMALNEIKKANEYENSMKQDKGATDIELENCKGILNQQNLQLQEFQKQIYNQAETIRQLESRLGDAENLPGSGKYSDLQNLNQKRLAEISQLKMVNDRITKENDMWSKKIKGWEERNKKVDEMEASLKAAKQATIADKTNLKGMTQKFQKCLEMNQQLQKINASVKKANADLIERSKEKMEAAITEAKKASASDKGTIKEMVEKMKAMKEQNEQLTKINSSVKQANAELIAKSKEKLEIALGEVKKANEVKKSMSSNIHDLEESNKQLQEFAKSLKSQNPENFKKDFETSKKVISSLNEQLSNQRKKIYEQTEKIKELETEAKKVTFYENFSEQGADALEYKKRYAELVSINKGRSKEIEELKAKLKKAESSGSSGEPLIPTKNIKKEKGAENDDNDDFKSKEKAYKETLEKKDRELAKFKAENAKFQIMMKKDLEKIKKMSLAYDPSNNKSADQLKEAKATIEKLKKQNTQFRSILKDSKKRSEAAAANQQSQNSDTAEEQPAHKEIKKEKFFDANNNNQNSDKMDDNDSTNPLGDAENNEESDTTWNNIPLT